MNTDPAIAALNEAITRIENGEADITLALWDVLHCTNNTQLFPRVISLVAQALPDAVVHNSDGVLALCENPNVTKKEMLDVLSKARAMLQREMK